MFAVDEFVAGGPRSTFYMTSSRMVPYKKMHLIVEAFAKMPDRQLVVIGTGPQYRRCAALAGPNVTMLGYQPYSVLLSHMQRARAFIFRRRRGLRHHPCRGPGVRHTCTGLW